MHDSYWLETARFVKTLAVCAHEIVAPRGFEELIDCIVYGSHHKQTSPRVVVLHKGQLDLLSYEWIEMATAHLQPLFANEVFVVFAEGKQMPSILQSPHFLSFKEKLKQLVQRVQPGAVGDRTRMAIYLGDHLALTKSIYGHKIYVDTRDISLAPHILLDGCWEQWITNVFRELIRPGMQVLDIGANVGWYSLLAADMIGPEGRLTSFEANPAIADILYRNLMVNGFLDRARVVAKAVYSESKQLEFKVYERYMGSSSLFGTAESAAVFKDTVKTLRVKAVSLDEFFPAGAKIDFIKIDAEGAEPYILKGATRLLSENRHVQIMMEFVPSIITPSYGSIELFYRDITTLGFSVYRIGHDSGLVESSLDELLSVVHCDVVLKR